MGAPGVRGNAEVQVAKNTRFQSSSDLSDMMHLNVGGQEKIRISRSALTQCEGSRMASDFSRSGEKSMPKDEDGRIFVSFSPTIFIPLVEHLRTRHIEAVQAQPTRGQASARQSPPPPPFANPRLEDEYVDMLRYYGVLDWVYRQRSVEFQVRIDDYDYSVLPAQPPDMGQVLNEMRDFTVTVPRGWQVLTDADENFDQVIWELTKRCWGTSVLITKQALGNYEGYHTQLSQTGIAGSKVAHGEAPARWFQSVTDAGRKLKFGNASCRVVIFSRATT